MAQLHGSTAENAVWVLPRSHRWGHLDIPQIIAQHGERVPGALPLITNPGDVAMCNRNCLHCSYPNTSDRTRITLNFGFHKRSAVDAAGELLRLPQVMNSQIIPRRRPPLCAHKRRPSEPRANSGNTINV